MPQLDSFLDFDFKIVRLPIITVFDHPLDYPDHFVARLFDVDQGTSYFILKDNLGDIRRAIPSQFYRLARDPTDDPYITEVWL